MPRGWILACALLLHPGLCLRLNRSPPKNGVQRVARRVPPEDELAKLSPSTLKKLSNHNYIFVGDSNERQAMTNAFGALGHTLAFESMGDDSAENAITVSPEGVGQHLLVVKVPQYNITGIYLFFAGAMTVSPRPAWNVEAIDEHPMRKEWQWKHKNGTLVSYEEMANTYWPKAAKQHLKEDHPTVLLTQSSLWDAIMSRDFEFKYEGGSEMDKEKDQVRLREFKRRASSSSQQFLSWKWTDHVQKHIEMTRDSMEKSGVHLDQVIWRTNPNCVDPLTDPVDWDSEILQEQAVSIRNLADSKEGIGPGVTLMDLRKESEGTDVCENRPGYIQHHFSPGGVAKFWDLFAAKIN